MISPAGTGSASLPAHGTLVIGRAPECDVRIEDAKVVAPSVELRAAARDPSGRSGKSQWKLSPRRARGTQRPHVVRVGDVAIGSTLVSSSRFRNGERPLTSGATGISRRGWRTSAISLPGGGFPFAIFRLRVQAGRADAPTKDAGSETTALLADLHGADMLAGYAPHEYEALFTRMTAEEAATLALPPSARRSRPRERPSPSPSLPTRATDGPRRL